MFIAQGIKPHNEFWRYIAGIIAIFTAMIIGQLPITIAIGYEIAQGHEMPADENGFLKFLEPNLTLFLILLSFVTAFIGLIFVIKQLHGQTLKEITTARTKVDWKRIFFSFGLWSVFSIITTSISYFNNPENFVYNFKLLPFVILFIIAIVMIPVQTSVEEYIFRGYLMQGLAVLAKNKWIPLIITSFGFGLMHIANPEVDKMGYGILAYYIGTGLFLGIITLMDDGLELSLGFHAANNLVNALMVTSDWSAFQTHSIFKDLSEPSAGIDIILPVFVIFPILLVIFSKKYNWDNWKEKLFGKIEIGA